MSEFNKVDEGQEFVIPPVKNWLFYVYGCVMKLLLIAFFGVGGVFIGVLIFPWIRIFVHPNKRFQAAARAFVSASFRMFVNCMRMFGVVKLYVDDRKKFRNLHSSVLVANHPSLLDFVFIMSMVPNANCIVNSGLLKGPLAVIIRQCYIPNSVDFDVLKARCRETLEMGNNVIIFPEGTRTPLNGHNPYKKGAARIALDAKCKVQPILCAGSDKHGLRKHNPFFSYNHVEPYVYDFKLLEPIDTKEYEGLEESIAAKRLTEKMKSSIYSAAAEYNRNHPRCKTVNNY